jgi:hypothetical protein
MLDEPWKTEMLMALLKENVPIPASIPPYLAGVLAKGMPEGVPDQCNVVDVIYSGETAGILCQLDISGSDPKHVHLVSITHLVFRRRVPLAREIEAYQRHRIKKLKQQGESLFCRPVTLVPSETGPQTPPC